MNLSERQVSIVNQLYMMNLTLARGDEGQRRQLTQKIDEQIRFEFGPRWGMKARAGGNISTASKDAIGYLEDDGTVSVWDWQNGSSREPQVHAGEAPHYPHLPLSEAAFIPVEAVNHLSSVPDNGGETEDDPNVAKILEVVQKILTTQQTILENQVRLSQAMQVLIDKPFPEIPPITFPEYVASNRFLGTITLKPKQ